MPNGTCDLRAEGSSHNLIATQMGVSIPPTTSWNVTGGLAPAPPSTLDYSASPNYGSLSLAAGFTPDPYTVSITSGGLVDVSYLGGGCAGYASAAPDIRINWSGVSPRLRMFYVASGGQDPVMIINTPTGSWLCNDDFGGLNPMIELVNPSPGQFDVWVGSLSSGVFDPGALYITELDYTPSNHP